MENINQINNQICITYRPGNITQDQSENKALKQTIAPLQHCLFNGTTDRYYFRTYLI